MIWETVFLKNHTQNVAGKLVPDTFIKKCCPLAFTIYKGFLKNLFIFLHDSRRKIILTLYSTNWPSLVDWLPFLLEVLGNVGNVIICYAVCNVLDFGIKLSFFLSNRFPKWPKGQDKNLDILRTKRAFNMK